MEWYYADGDERRGPVSEEEFSELNRAGKIGPATLVWHEGWSEWRRFGDASAALQPHGNASCVECGKVFPTSEMIQYEGSWVCAGCKAVFFQKVKEGVPIARGMIYAGFWIRFLAKFVDGLILQVAGFALRLVPGLVSADPEVQVRLVFLNFGLSIVIAASYNIFFVGKFGATPGKMATRLRIVRANGDKVTYGRACGRYFAEFLSSFILLIGYIMAAFDEEKRALHDRICDTRVIRQPA